MPEEPIIRTLDDLLKSTQICIHDFSVRAWFRGHADASWSLMPSVFRNPKGAQQEQNMCCDFLLSAPSRHSGCPLLEDNFAWLTLMRHYGLPTRILDWTTSILVAAYFAVCDEREADATIWALSPTRLNEITAGKPFIHGPRTPEVLIYAHLAIHGGSESEAGALAVMPQQIDNRLMLQQSKFTIHGCAQSLDNMPQRGEFLRKFTILRKDRRELRMQLAAVGIRRSSLFADLNTLAGEIAADRCDGVPL